MALSDTGLDINLLDEIAIYFREVKEKHAQPEGRFRKRCRS